MSTEGQFGVTRWWRSRTIIVFLAFAAIAVFFLWQEHRAHLLGALPFVLLLLCPLLHLFMHRGHGNGPGKSGQHGDHG